jgi:hypothetical protein
MSERYNASNNYSLYIPAIGNMNQEQISQIFWEKCVGIVNRVDYFQNEAGAWSAFVHFQSVNNNSFVNIISNEIQEHGSYQFWFNDYEYLILRKMTCRRIPDTRLNIHQIAGKLEEKDDHIELLQYIANCDEEKIANLEKRVSELENIIFQLKIESNRTRWENSQDEEMEKMVTSLVGPRWTEEDDMDAMSPVFVACNESKFDDNGNEYELDFADMM